MAYPNRISEAELRQYKSLSIQTKVDVMALYLLGDNGFYYNMDEVALKMFQRQGL